MERSNNTPQEILTAIKSSKSILLIMDSRFDYDALGSVLAFSDFLIQIGKQHTCVYGDEIINKGRELFDVSRIKQKVSFANFDYSPYDLVVFLDTGNLSHFDDYYPFTPPKDTKILNIDHHAGNECYGTYNCASVQASTCSVLYGLFKVWKVKISADIANYLLTGLVSDTGIFQYSLVNSKEFKIAGELIDLGGNYYKIIEHLTLNENLEDMRVKGIVYSRLSVDCKRGFAYSYLLEEDLRKNGIDKFQVTPADLIRPLKGIDFAFVIKTKKGVNNWIVSLRSHDVNYDVLRIAKALGGGGHKGGASGTVPFEDAKTIDDVVKKVWEIASQKE